MILPIVVLLFAVSGCAIWNESQTVTKVSPRSSPAASPVSSPVSSNIDGKPVTGQTGPVPIDKDRMDDSYVIGPEDVLEVSVWKNNDLSKTVKVRPDGQISLPLIGDVKASGLTPTQLKDSIASKLKEYKETPMVSVIVQEINSYNIFVMGEVAHPGKYNLKSNTTFLQALSMAGGFTAYASKNKILLMRQDPKTMAVTEIRVKYDEVISGRNPQRDILLKPNDTIVVP
jgi:polysaccharide export outer membrane protein